jgi:hypothetical protein
MEPKFNKKNSGNSSSISTHLIAYRNLGNERFLKGDYEGSIQAFSEAWNAYENEKRPKSTEIDSLMT